MVYDGNSQEIDRLSMKRQTSAYIHAVAAVLLWSTAASAFKLTLRHADVMGMLLWASVVSLAFLAVFAGVTGRFGSLKGLTARQWAASAFLGFLNPFLYYVVLFKAYAVLTAQEALVLNYTWPVMLVLLSVPLLGQKLTVRGLASLAVSFAGVVVIATGGHVLAFRFTDPAGVALALASAVIWALYWIYNVRDKREEATKLLLNFLFGFLFIVAAVSLSDGVRLPSAAGFAGMAYIGMFEMGVTFVLWLRGLRLSETAAKVSVFVYASPFISLGFIRLAVGERIAPSTFAGLALIVSGILLQHIRIQAGNA